MKSDFYTEAEIEELFVRGISAGASKKGVSQDELKKITKSAFVNLGRTALTNVEKNAAEGKGKTFHHWYRAHNGGHPAASLTMGHTQKLQPGGYFDCDILVDEWFKWFLTTPRPNNPFSNPGGRRSVETGLYGQENVFLMEKRDTRAYFTTAAPFQEPDWKTITLTKEGYLLAPAYNVFASEEMFPSLDDKEKLLVEITSDLFGIRIDDIEAEFDGQTIEPCCVIRKEPLRITGIPLDNVYGIPPDRLNESGSSVNILHGGFWILIKQEAITSGDHLLEWKVESVNYKTNAYISINTQI